MSTSRKCKTLSIKVKQQIIQAVKSGEKQVEVAKKFNIAPSTLTSILKKADCYLELSSTSKRKRQRSAEYPELERKLLTWFSQCRHSNLPVGGILLKEKAKVFAEKLGITSFRASNGWLENFKVPNNITFRKVCGESAVVDLDVCAEWKNKLQTLIENCEPKNVFNADETGLFYKCLPDRTMSLKGESCHGGKLSKDRITLLLAANMDGSEILKPLMIGKSLKPRCFKNIKTFPMTYRANKKAWMTRDLFIEWLQLLNRKMAEENRKKLLFIDNCTAHSIQESSSRLQIKFLPANTTSLLQPLDKGVIQNFKTYYQKEVVRQLLDSLEDGKKSYLVNIFCNEHCPQSLDKCQDVNYQKLFPACGFFQDQDALILHDEWINIEQWDRVPQNCNTSISFKEYVHFDDDLVIAGILDDDEILGVEHDEDIEDSDQNVEIPVISSKTAKESIENLRNYFMSSNVDENVLNDIVKLGNALDNLRRNNTVQTQITNFFK